MSEVCSLNSFPSLKELIKKESYNFSFYLFLNLAGGVGVNGWPDMRLFQPFISALTGLVFAEANRNANKVMPKVRVTFFHICI